MKCSRRCFWLVCFVIGLFFSVSNTMGAWYLADDFSDSSLDIGSWDVTVQNGGTATIVDGQLRCYSPALSASPFSNAYVLLKMYNGQTGFTLNDGDTPGTVKLALDFKMASGTSRGYYNGGLIFKNAIDTSNISGYMSGYGTGATVFGFAGAGIYNGSTWGFDHEFHVEATITATEVDMKVFNVDPAATGPESYTDSTPDVADTTAGGMLYHITDSRTTLETDEFHLMLSGSFDSDVNPSEVFFDNIYTNFPPPPEAPTWYLADDFSGGSLDTSAWDVTAENGGTATIVDGQLCCYSPAAAASPFSNAYVLLKMTNGQTGFTLNDADTPGTVRLALDFTMDSSTDRGYYNGGVVFINAIGTGYANMWGYGGTGKAVFGPSGGGAVVTPTTGDADDRTFHVEITITATGQEMKVYNFDPTATSPASYTDSTPNDADTAPGGMLYHITKAWSTLETDKFYLMLSGSWNSDMYQSEVYFDNIYTNLSPASSSTTWYLADDFSGGSVDTSRWGANEENGATVTVAGGRLRCYSPEVTDYAFSKAYAYLKLANGQTEFTQDDAALTLNDSDTPGTLRLALDFEMASATQKGFKNGALIFKNAISMASPFCHMYGYADGKTVFGLSGAAYVSSPGWGDNRPFHVQTTITTTSVDMKVFNVDPAATGPASYIDATPNDADTAPGAMLYHITKALPISMSDKFYLLLSGSVCDDRYLSEVYFDNVYTNVSPVATPVFSPAGPEISGPTSIEMSTSVTGGSIYYTTDGTRPTASSTLYSGAVTVNDGDILKAITVTSDGMASMVTRMDYAIPTIPTAAWAGIPDSFVTAAKFKEMREAGFTHQISGYWTCDSAQNAIDCAWDAGIKLFLHKPAEVVEEFIPQFKFHPALEGYFLQDEPTEGDFDALAYTVEVYQRMNANHWNYIDLYATYGSGSISEYQNYVDTFMSTVPVEVLSYNHYPVTTSGIRSDFYENLEIISAAAADAGIPFWAFANSVTHASYPVPTLTHLRFQMFSNLAYGAQGLQYFTYWQPEDYDSYVFSDAPIDLSGNRTSTWYAVQSMNQEIKDLSGVFLGAEVVSVGHTGSLPSGTTAYSPSAPILSLTTTGSSGAVVSEMVNGQSSYLVIVNRDIVNTMTLNISVDTARNLSRVAKDGSVTALTSGTVQYMVDPADIVILKWSNVLPGDANNDGAVDVGDLGILAANYGTASGATWSQGDFNGDGAVDVGDLGILAANYGTGSSSANWDADYATAFGQSIADDEAEEDTTTLCSALGLPLIVGLVLVGLLFVKLEE